MPLRQFGTENQRSLPFMSQDPPIRSAPSKRLMMSFWDREIHIWRLNKQAKIASRNGEAVPKNRRLVAKVLIKGEANITSAALSTDGRILAASTATDIKLFHLKPCKPEEGSDSLRISRIPIPGSLTGGARLVQFSPDRKWLCIIRPDSRVILARLLPTASSISIHTQSCKLIRLERKIEKRITFGGLGTYDRTITQAAFSHDSRILAVSDLAGYIDTWVLSGVEDPTLTNATEEAASSSESDDSDSEEESEEEGAKIRQICGQNWTRNPFASAMPKVPATPTVLSFRPASPSRSASNGVTTHAIPTRHNPNPISHDLPSGEDRLLVVTATSDVFEFKVLKGALSSWSRRNPTSAFPAPFTRLIDQARGCVWDISGSRERLWLYGIGWLWMIDLSQDFPILIEPVNGESSGSKRKRGSEERSHSGAGSSIPDRRLGTGISRKMQRVIHEEVSEFYDIVSGHSDAMDLDDEDDQEDDSPALDQLRRNSTNAEDKEPFTNGAVTAAEVLEAAKVKPYNYWSTFKYRPILGMCVIGEAHEGDNGPEVAIVERPIWEADLGPRYVGDQEWEKPDVWEKHPGYELF